MCARKALTEGVGGGSCETLWHYSWLVKVIIINTYIPRPSVRYPYQGSGNETIHIYTYIPVNTAKNKGLHISTIFEFSTVLKWLVNKYWHWIRTENETYWSPTGIYTHWLLNVNVRFINHSFCNYCNWLQLQITITTPLSHIYRGLTALGFQTDERIRTPINTIRQKHVSKVRISIISAIFELLTVLIWWTHKQWTLKKEELKCWQCY